MVADFAPVRAVSPTVNFGSPAPPKLDERQPTGWPLATSSNDGFLIRLTGVLGSLLLAASGWGGGAALALPREATRTWRRKAASCFAAAETAASGIQRS